MLRKYLRLVIALIVASLSLYYATIPIFGAHYAKVCRKGEYGPPDQCSYYDVVSAFVGRSFVFADNHSGIITALAGVAVAAFTGVLWIATHKLWLASERQGALARDEFEAAHRPWLAVRDLRVSGDIFFAKTVCVPVEIDLENTGSAPVLGFFAYIDGIPFDAKGDAINRVLRSQIERYARENGTPLTGDKLPFGVLFPKDRVPHPHHVEVELDQLRGIGKNIDALKMTLLLVGTLFYTSPHDGLERRTSFAYTSPC